MRATPARQIREWLEQTTDDTFLTTVITVREIECGIARLPEGNRRSDLEHRFSTLIGEETGLIALPFDEPSARRAGVLRHHREAQGLHAHPSDMFIAGIAVQHGAAVATRNASDFSHLGVDLINPWG